MEPKLRKPKSSKDLLYLAIFVACALGMLAYYLYYCKDVVLACHDSLAEFTYAKMFGWKWAYKYSYRFIVSRGRYSRIFPAIICFRFWVHEKGNFLAVWLLQYVPVYANVFLLSAVVGKKTRKEYGIMLGLFFMVFLQINVGHSLIICYPLEFMYALFIAILGLVLFESFLEKPKLSGIWKVALSCFLYYESIQAYEAFLVTAACYAVIAFNYMLKAAKGKKLIVKVWTFIKVLIPHIIVSIIFLCIFKYLRDHPQYPELSVINIDDHGTFKGFLKCWFYFSTGMLPLRNFIEEFEGACKNLAQFSIRNIAIFIISGLGAYTGTTIILKRASSEDEDMLKKINRALVVMGLAGLALACMFSVPHAMTGNYQMWITLGAKHYVPSTICYYGWVVFIVCFSCLILNVLSRKEHKLVKPITTIVVTLLFAVGGLLTVNTNDVYKRMETSTTPYISYKAQAYYSLCTSKTFDEWDIDYIYTPGYCYSGIHNNIENIESFMEFELGNEAVEINNEAGFISNYQNYNNPAMLKYDASAHVAYVMPITDVVFDEDGNWEVLTSGEILIVSPHGGSYELYDGNDMICEFSQGSWSEHIITIDTPVVCDDLDIVMD